MCRISAFSGGLEEDVKLLQQRDLGPRERVAAQLRLSEKRILRGTMEGVRRRLAPIRGIPTKVRGGPLFLLFVPSLWCWLCQCDGLCH